MPTESLETTAPVVTPAASRTVTVAPWIGAPTEGPPAPCVTVPEIAPGWMMLVVAVAESLAEFGSRVSVLTDAVLLTEPLVAVTLTTSTYVALAPLARFAREQLTVPVPFTAGVEHPALGLRLWNVVPAGMGSVRLRLTARSGPLLWTVIV